MNVINSSNHSLIKKSNEFIDDNNSYHHEDEFNDLNHYDENNSENKSEGDDDEENLKGSKEETEKLKKDKKERKKEPQSILIKEYVVFLLSLHYIWHLLILVLGYCMNWISLFFYWEIPLYVFLSFTNILIEMLFNNPNKISPIPLYNSLFPYTFFLILSREKHQLYNILWFTSIIIIYSQKSMKNLLLHLFVFSFLYTAIYVIYICIINQITYKDITIASIVWLVKAKVKDYQFNNKIFYEILLESSFSIIYVIIVLAIIYILKYSSNNFKKKTELKENILYLIKENKKLNEIQKKKLYKNLDQDHFLYKVVSILDNIKKKSIYNHQLVNDLDNTIFLMLSNKQIFENFDIEENNNLEVYRYLNVITDYDSVNSYSTLQDEEFDEKNDGDIRNSQSSFNIYEIEEHLKTAMDWNFDVFKLSNISNCKPIYYLGKRIFEKHKFCKHFNIKQSTVEAFLTKMENQYHMALPYHNNIHAADVLHSINYFISHPMLDKLLTIEEKFACVVAAIAHDVDHPGINNSYEIKHLEPLSIIYNNKSILENHHCALTFKILNECPECNVFKNLTKSQYTYIRSLIIAMILSTDMTYHKDYVNEFTEKINNQTFNIDDSKDRKLLFCMLIKSADISNPTKIHNLSIRWSNRLFKENSIQSISEKKKDVYNLKSLINENYPSICESQTSFIRLFVKPIYDSLGSYLEIEDFIALKQLEDNYNFWDRIKG